jgi:repressor LexA
MTYAELLKKYIKDSRYTLEEISKFLLDKGLSASREHLSRLQNGKVPPATDEINKAICQITGGDEDKLIWYAYIEKAPKGFQEILYAVGDQIIPLGKKVNEKFPGFLEGKYYESALKLEPEYIEFQKAIKNALINTIPGPKGLNFSLEGKAVQNNREVSEDGVVYYVRDFQKINNLIRVPTLGYIAAGAPILAEEHVIEQNEIVNPGNYAEGELFILLVKGDSMTGSRIFPNDKVLVKIQPEVENGEIAVVNVDGENATLKKVKKYENGSVWLISTNEKYAPIPLSNEKARIIGKVIQVIFEP